MTTAALRFELSATMDGFRSAVGDAEARWNQATAAMRRAAGDATAGMSGLGERAKASFTGVSQAANAAATAMRTETTAAALAGAASLDTMAERAAASFGRVPGAAHQARQKIEEDFTQLYAATGRTFASIADGAERSFADLYPAVAASTSKASQAVAAAVQVTERTFADLVPAVAASTQASGTAVASFSDRAKASFAGLAESARGAIRGTEQSFADLYAPTERTRGVFAGLADRARTSFAAVGQAAQTGTQAAEAALQRHSGVVGTITASLSRQLSGAVGAYLGFAAIGATVRGAINATKEIDDLGDIADAAGLTTTKYQELRFAAEQTGAAHEELDRAILKFSEGLGGVRTHAGDLYEFLKYADQQLLAQLQTTTDSAAAFDVMAAAIRNLSSDQDKALLRMKAFGEVGRKVADMIAGDYKAAGQKAHEFGLIFSRDVIDKAGELQSKWVTASSVFGHTLKEALLTVMPLATKTLEIFNAIAEKIGAIGAWLSNTPLIKRSADFVPSGIARLAEQGLDDTSYLAAQQANLLRTQNAITTLDQRLAQRKTQSFGGPFEIIADGTVTTMEANLAKLRKQAEEYEGLIALGGLRGTIVDLPPAVMPPPPRNKKLRTKPDGGAGSPDLFADLKADLEASIGLHERMAEAVGASEGAMARWRANLEITNADQKAGNKLTADQKAELRGLTQQLEAATDAAEQARSRFETFMEVGQTVASSLEDGFGRMITGTKVNFKDLVNGMLQDLAKLAFRANVIEPLFGGRSGNGAWGSMFGSIAGSLGGGSAAAAGSFRGAQEATSGGGFFGTLASSIGSAFGGFRERGGAVEPGKAYIVGEKRPELFIPDVRGTIVPVIPPGASVASAPKRPERSSIHPATAVPRLPVGVVKPLLAPEVPRGITAPNTGLAPRWPTAQRLVLPSIAPPHVTATIIRVPMPAATSQRSLAASAPVVPTRPPIRDNGRGGYFSNAIMHGMRAVQSFAAEPERASQVNTGLGGVTRAVGNLFGTTFGGFREAGGDVDAGRSYIVGEKRPELFVPRVAGSIMPRLPAVPTAVSPSQPANAVAQPVTVTNVYNIDARAAEIGVEKRIMAGLAMIERNRPSPAAVVAQQQRRHPYRAA